MADQRPWSKPAHFTDGSPRCPKCGGTLYQTSYRSLVACANLGCPLIPKRAVMDLWKESPFAKTIPPER